MATAVAKRETASVPALVQTPALAITADDIALPRLSLGQFMSGAVQEKLVELGDIYSSTGKDDPDPQVLWAYNEDRAKQALGVLIYVVGLRKNKSFSDGGELQIFDFDDPSAPPEAWTAYNYTLACPELDEDVPFKLTLTKTGRPAAQKINTVLAKQSIVGPSYINAFRLTSAVRSNAKGKFAVAQVAQVESDPDQIKVAEKLFLLTGSTASQHAASTGDQPAI